MMIKPFDIVSSYIAFVQDEHSGKRRPVLVLRTLNHGKILRVLVITSKYKGKSNQIRQHRYLIQGWRKDGLEKLSYIDITEHCTLLTSAFKIYRIGHLSFPEIVKLLVFIKQFRETK